ncbi:hypothetical protein EDD36DRAFT_465164 [Exophiala viscosa]|uniref:Xylanolytic transcriptional activator regulatory domain-containing protein n=1 Tax=Exophiala viscosa TaxID=2486360 RepID=A0AAN6DVS8_9EURO|nr:hypothetical protein EDD36DRAFT_465164 [Exophiala viscosa]
MTAASALEPPPSIPKKQRLMDVCSYESGKKPRQTPTERIRILESRLRSVRTALENLKAENATTSSSAVDKILKTVDLSLPAPNDGFSSSDEDEAKSSRLNSMMGNSGRSFAHGPWQTSFYGSYSGCSFVLRTLELFRTTPENVALMVDIRKVITDLFEAPFEGMESLAVDARSQPLPNQATTLDLLRVVFTRCHPLVSFLHEANFRDMVYRLYNEAAVAFSTSSQAFMPLFHAVVGLGLLFDIESRKQYGCEYAVAEATKHFLLAKERLDITQCSDLISLQTLMCLTIFLISTSRITAAHAYLGVACSTALRLGLHKRVEEGILLSPAQRDTRNRLFVSLLQLDLYVSLVLDIPGFVDLECIDPEIMTKLQPSTSGRSPYPFDVTAESRAQFSASAKHLELLSITATGLQTTFAGADRKHNQAENELEFTDVDIKTLHGVEEKFRKWAKGLSSLPSLPEDPEVSATMKFALEMTFYFGQLVLYQPFLHYLIPMAKGSAITKTQSEHALACIKVAGTTISRTDVMYQRGLLCPASWSTIYTLYLAVSSLLFLIATHPGTSRPSNAWKKSERGIRLLATMRCYDNGAVKCLLIIKMLIQQLSHTVLFDVDHIVATTSGLCPCSASGSLPADPLRRPMSKDDAVALGLSTGYPTPETNLDVRHPPPVWAAVAPGQEHLQPWYAASHDSPYRDADSILAEAQAISLTVPIDTLDIFGGI